MSKCAEASKRGDGNFQESRHAERSLAPRVRPQRSAQYGPSGGAQVAGARNRIWATARGSETELAHVAGHKAGRVANGKLREFRAGGENWGLVDHHVHVAKSAAGLGVRFLLFVRCSLSRSAKIFFRIGKIRGKGVCLPLCFECRISSTLDERSIVCLTS